MSYTPPQEILEKYAKVLVDYALGGGTGIKKGDVVLIKGHEVTKPLYVEVQKAVWRSGGHVIDSFVLDETNRGGTSRQFFDIASAEQLKFFPEKFYRGLTDEMDHSISLEGEQDPKILQGVGSDAIMQNLASRKPWMEWRTAKENAGKFTWTLGLYGTKGLAAEAKMSEEEYWEQIIKACFLDEADPIAKWREVVAQIQTFQAKLNLLPIEKLHIEGVDADLWVKLGEKRQWIGGSGRNIPSFEIFTSPDWRGTEGWIRFNQPLYVYGNLLKGVRLEFRAGNVVDATAEEGETVLKNMIATAGANQVGEFSLTDSRHSRITKFMAHTLFDENVGGKYGNTHLALGSSYHDCYDGDMSAVSREEWARLGFNDSSVHTDIVSTTDRTVTATLCDGSQQIIYRNGQFQL